MKHINNPNSSTFSNIEVNVTDPNIIENQNDPLIENEPPENILTRKWGSFHCDKFKNGRKCDLCSHMVEKGCINSFHFGVYAKVHGHLCHDKPPEGILRWFIYCIEDVPCQKLILGSTKNPNNRWSTPKCV